jgi:hypothetical protein
MIVKYKGKRHGTNYFSLPISEYVEKQFFNASHDKTAQEFRLENLIESHARLIEVLYKNHKISINDINHVLKSEEGDEILELV